MTPDQGKTDIPIARRAQDIAHLRDRVYVIDSGSSCSCIADDIAEEHLSHLIRDTKTDMEFDTANGRIVVKRGIRAMASPWDDVTDFMCMEESPDLLSTGEHCLLSTFSHVWVNKKFPCFISKGGQIYHHF